MAYRDSGLSYREIGPRVGRHPATVMRVWNRWVQEGQTDRRERSPQPRHATDREDRHVVHRALTDRTATSRTLAQELGHVVQQPVSARTFPRRLQQRGLVARRLFLR
ncbi:hypothetical protein JGG43_23985 [Salmonella enterica subsp. enterica serovar Typhimurium]|nr:hypothetical protein [Salmonella enterica subsp. enterica serovar Typhimurium]